MTEPTLQSTLTLLNAEREHEQAHLREQLGSTEVRRHAILQELLALQAELDSLLRVQGALAEQNTMLAQAYAHREYDLCLASLHATGERLAAAIAASSSRSALVARRDTLLASEQALAQEWQSYLEFEAARDTLLAPLPAYHRSKLLISQESLRARVQPLIDLESELGAAIVISTVPVDCLLYHDQDTADLVLVLPVANVAGDAHWPQLVRRFWNALFELGKRPDWEIVELAPSSWAGYVAIHMLAEYRGPLPIADACEAALVEQLAAANVDGEPQLGLRVGVLSTAAWRLGCPLPAASPFASVGGAADNMEVEADILPDQVAMQAAEVGAESGEREPIEGLQPTADGWYTEDDIKAWSRQLKVGVSSKWSRPARIARTLLMRMIAHGHVGASPIAEEQLSRGLPTRYARELGRLTERLIQSNLILTAEEGGSSVGVAINPDLLDEVQNLINRTVSPFWEEVLAAS